MNWKIGRLAAIFVFIILTIGCGTRVQPVYEVRGAPIPASSGNLTMSDIRGAIQSAAYRRNWKVENRGGNQLLAILDVRKHHAEVIVSYSPSQFSLIYHKSSGLLYKNGRVHRSYNKWVRNLENDIRSELARTRSTRQKTVAPVKATVKVKRRRTSAPTSRKSSRTKSVVPD